MQPLTTSQMEALELAVKSYEAAFTAAEAGYLLGRGLDREIVRTARLGVVREPHPGHAKHQGMLAIPYLDRYGKPLTVRFRCLQEHDHREFYHGKYVSLPEEPARMYNIKAIFDAGDTIHVTEGELDALVLTKVGLNAVAIPGANSFMPRHSNMLAGFSRVWVWGDPDEAGAEFVNKITKRMRTARGVNLRIGDVTDTYLAGGATALLDLIGA